MSHSYSPKPSFRRRIIALGIDYLLILAWMLTIGVIGFVLYSIMGKYPDYLGLFGPFGTQLIFFTILTLPVEIYLYVTESSVYHATFGKRKAGLRVISAASGVHPSHVQIFIRTVIKLLPWELAHTFIWQLQYIFYTKGYDAVVPVWIFVGMSMASILAVFYVLIIACRKDGRGLHDLLSGTKVILNP